MCSSPPRSPTIVGSAVETMVWSSDASSMTIINPLATISTPRRSVVAVTRSSVPLRATMYVAAQAPARRSQGRHRGTAPQIFPSARRPLGGIEERSSQRIRR
jgi:hypothetical protein